MGPLSWSHGNLEMLVVGEGEKPENPEKNLSSNHIWTWATIEGKCYQHWINNGIMANNRPRSIYQYSNMALRLSGQTSISGVVFYVSWSLLGIERQEKLKKNTILTQKPMSHVRILICRTWPILSWQLYLQGCQKFFSYQVPWSSHP